MRAPISLPIIAAISGITLITFLGIVQLTDLKSFEKFSFNPQNVPEISSNTNINTNPSIPSTPAHPFDTQFHQVQTAEEGFQVLSKQMSPAEYLADTYREQNYFCKLIPALKTAATQPTRKNMNLTEINAEFDILLYAADDIVSNNILYLGSWESNLTYGIASRLKEVSNEIGSTAVFLDIGANVGFHSLAVAAAGYPVVAFEPLPQNLLLIRWSLCENPKLKMELYGKGLGEKKDNCRIISHDINVGDGLTKCATNGVFPPLDAGYSTRAEISIDRLDDIMGDRFAAHNPNGQRIGVLKIDVEGYETNAFRGGLKFLEAAKIPFIAAEIGFGGYAGIKEFLTILDKLGYELRVGDWDTGKALKRTDISAYSKSVQYLADVVFVHRDWMESHPASKPLAYWP